MRQESSLQTEQEAEKRPLSVYERKLRSGGKEAARLWKNASIKALPTSTNDNFIFEGFARMHVCPAIVWRPKPKRNLVIGSVPFLRLSNNNRFFDNPGPEVWLPLASDVAVALFREEQDKVRILKDKQIRTLNEGIFRQSKVIAGCSPQLIGLLAREKLSSPIHDDQQECCFDPYQWGFMEIKYDMLEEIERSAIQRRTS